ncbi:hypothetical protein [uncultured Clostridium sp.]|uniref:hypothetical protein n=1 Tax=uncultured Clostridium sp. TaxID=59620 RepID=UPI00321643C0
MLSILFWKFDRHDLAIKVNEKFSARIRDKSVLQWVYFILIIILGVIISLISNSEIVNALVAFFVIEISNSERKTVIKKSTEKKEFYNTLSLISKSLICGFLAPLIYILIIGNTGGVIYTLIYYTSDDEGLKFINSILNMLNIIPTLIGGMFLYIVYVIRNKTFKINFKGDFFINIFTNPLLNIYILAAYIESVNFYYIQDKGVHYLKSYGVYQGKIDDLCVKDFLTVIYGVCFIFFVIFWIYMVNKGSMIKLIVI